MIKTQRISNHGEVVIYQAKDGCVSLDVKLQQETVWLTQKQMALLFNKDVRTINEHIKNIYKEGELENVSTIRKFRIVQKEGSRNIKREVDCYNLDAIISIGYRVNSKQGTQFRIWATQVLKKHLINGYTLNEKRLNQQEEKFKSLQDAVRLLGDVSRRKALTSDEASGLLHVITDYSYALDVLDDYDHETLKVTDISANGTYQITYEEAQKVIIKLKETFGGSSLFGLEKDKSFRSSLGAIYQSFNSKDLYPSVEEKACHFLYFVVKNHSFTDGNKRIAAALFIWFLQKNGILYRADGSKRIADNALVALTLLIAESNPKEKETIVRLIINLINKKN